MKLTSQLQSLQDSYDTHRNVQKLLIEASLHFLHVSTYGTLLSDTSAKTRQLLDLASSQSPIFHQKMTDDVDTLNEQWEKRIILGIYNLYMATERLSKDPSSKPLEDIILQYCTLYLKIIGSKESYNPEDYFYLNNSIQNYRDYAVPLINSISTSLASWIRDKGAIKTSALEKLFLINNVEIDLSSNPGVYGVCLMITKEKSDLADIDKYTNRALDLLDKADDAARIARMSKSFSDYLDGVLISHLLYSASTTSLNWIIARYEKNNNEPPKDLYDEKRVAEENRVESLVTLRSSCGSLITEPIQDMLGKSIMSDSVVNSQSIKKMLFDGAIRNPVYHEKLKSVWNQVVDDVFTHNHLNQMESSKVLGLASELQQSACKHFPDYFDDIAVSRSASMVQSKWYFNRVGFCRQDQNGAGGNV